MRVQFPAGYREGQEVDAEARSVPLDRDRCADLTEAEYLALQRAGVQVRFAAQSFERGKPIGAIGRAQTQAKLDAQRRTAAVVAGGADLPSKAELAGASS